MRLMVGRPLTALFEHQSSSTSDIVLSVQDLCTSWLQDISFEIHRGEVLGLAGLIGAGRTELAKTLFGYRRWRSGRLLLEGREIVVHSPADAIKEGICYVSEDRKGEGLVLMRSVRENTSISILRRLTRLRFIRARLERRIVSDLVGRLAVKTPTIEQEVGKLSGGNQQKVVLGRWLARQPRVFILDEPTRGVDVGAKAEIYRLIQRLAAEGMAILFISSELPEVIGVSDRILVMQSGRITGELSAAEASEAAILSLAMAEHLSPRSPTFGAAS